MLPRHPRKVCFSCHLNQLQGYSSLYTPTLSIITVAAFGFSRYAYYN
jgi:hypothetical protein